METIGTLLQFIVVCRLGARIVLMLHFLILIIALWLC